MCTKTPSSYWETTAFVKMEDSADASFIIKFFIPFITINMQVNVFYIMIVKLRHLNYRQLSCG